MNLLAMEKSLYPKRHPWKNLRPLTSTEKKARKEFKAVECFKVEGIMADKLKRRMA